MGCFLVCFGGDGDRRQRQRRSRKQSPARSPPRPNHVAVVRGASAAADVVLKEASPPLQGAKASKATLAVEVPGEVVVCEAAAADVVAKEASPPLRDVKASKLPPAVEVPDEAVGEALAAAAVVAVKEASPPLHGAKASTPPPAVAVADEVVTGASLGKELRELSEHKASPVCSLSPEKQATPPRFPVKCSPVVVAVGPTQDTVECSPVAAAVVSTPDSELRELSDHGSRSSGKKKVTFDMNITTYENAAVPDQEEGYFDDEDENHVQKTVVLPENHRYRNCTDSDDDVGDEYAEDDEYGDESDEEEEDYVDCKIDLLDEEELSIEENKQESHDSLFSLPMSNDQQNDTEVISPASKSSGTSVKEESPLIRANNPRDRGQYVRPVLNPVQNLSQWKEVKNLKAQAVPGKNPDKENIKLVPDVGANQAKMNSTNSSKKEVSVDASLSTWLASSENSTVDKAQSKSPCSISSVSREEKPVLGALTVDDLKQLSAASSPRRSPSHNREGAPILCTVGSYWSCTKQDNEYCSSRSDSGTNGIPQYNKQVQRGQTDLTGTRLPSMSGWIEL